MSETFPTPCFLLNAQRLKANLEKAAEVRRQADCKILLATKAFAMPSMFPLMRHYLDGTTASGLHEAQLGAETFGKEVHVYSPAYTEAEIDQLKDLSEHIYFNSAEQLKKFGDRVRGVGREVGLRVNPGFSHTTIGGALYDPCAPHSRFGELASNLDKVDWSGVDVFHVHALCESLADGSVALIDHVTEQFAPYLEKVSTVNFGGGHFIGKEGYHIRPLIESIQAFKERFDVEVVIEPGAGLVVDAGELHATVLALHENDGKIAILDTSASTHMPDVLEVPYTPQVVSAVPESDQTHKYILGGKTCMTGDVIGTYHFAEPLKAGDRIVFADQMQYSFVKNNMFNGTPLAQLAVQWDDGEVELLSEFGYEEFRTSLGY